MKRVTILLTAIFASVCLSAQIEAVEKFIEAHPDLDKYFVYQSQLRILNQDGDEDFNNLIKDVRKINAYVQEGDANVSKESYRSMIEELRNDDFEVYVEGTIEGTLINLMGRERGKNSYFVLAVNDPNNFALVELDGHLNLSYIKALDGLDFNKLQDILLDGGNKNKQDSIIID